MTKGKFTGLQCWDRKPMLLNGNFDKFVDVLGTAAAAATLLESEHRFELAGHHEPCSSGLTDIRLSDPVAQAYVHDNLCDDYEKHYQYAIMSAFCQAPSGRPRARLFACPVEKR